MSDSWILLIPEDPSVVPTQEQQLRACQRFGEIAPDADEINLIVSDTIEFFHCGVNSERVLCPSCGVEIPDAWWNERMNGDKQDGFTLSAYSTPCCGSQHTLHDLNYEWVQGFGRFALEVMNANIGKLDEERRQELEQILATRLRVVYRRL
jgi:hypothetical protein